MEDILNIQSRVAFDESIAHYEVHAHQPYTALSFNHSDEIRISIQHQDLCVLPSNSSIHICGKLSLADGGDATNTTLVNNAICHLFEDIRYEINGVEIDRCKNVGITTLMKNWVSLNPNQSLIIENAGWVDLEDNRKLTDASNNFNVSIPLSMIFGFAEDYRKIVINAKHELILTRSKDDKNAILQTHRTRGEGAAAVAYFEDVKINLTKVEWLMPYVTASDTNKIQLFNYLNKDKNISMSFRSWELYEYPALPRTTKQVWSIKTSNQLEKPRYVILGFQSDRRGVGKHDASRFDNCDISNVKLYLNSQYYPYNNLNFNISQYEFALLYDMYVNFQKSYYGKDPEPILQKLDFINKIPLIVIDCSKQNETLKNGPVDVRLEFEARENFPGLTAAYCLILHDRIIQYNPISGEVKKLV